MTWVWIAVFVLACIAPLTGYIYLIEVRAPSPEITTETDRQEAKV